MAIDVMWADEEKTLLTVRIHGIISWEQYHDACDTAVTMMTSVSHRVDIIYMAEVDVPAGNPLPHFKRASVKLQSVAHLGYCITIVPFHIRLARVFTNLLYRAYGLGSKFQTVYSLEEAQQMIAESRAQQANS